MSDTSGWAQVVVDTTIGLGSGLVGIVTALWRTKSRNDQAMFDLELRTERARAELELRFEHRIAESRHQIMAAIQATAVIPIERLEQRAGALEQDMAVVKDRAVRRNEVRREGA